MKNKMIHLSFTEHALGDYYFSLTNHRTLDDGRSDSHGQL